jgi:hypothetical protein
VRVWSAGLVATGARRLLIQINSPSEVGAELTYEPRKPVFSDLDRLDCRSRGGHLGGGGDARGLKRRTEAPHPRPAARHRRGHMHLTIRPRNIN